MSFEWDENKRLLNIEKHKIDFIDIVTSKYFPPKYRLELIKNNENRIISFGIFYERIICVVYTIREDVIRIISARPASKKERREYFGR